MIGKKLLVNIGRTKDIVIINKVEYTEVTNKYSLECTSVCNNTKINLIITADEIKKCLVK